MENGKSTRQLLNAVTQSTPKEDRELTVQLTEDQGTLSAGRDSPSALSVLKEFMAEGGTFHVAPCAGCWGKWKVGGEKREEGGGCWERGRQSRLSCWSGLYRRHSKPSGKVKKAANSFPSDQILVSLMASPSPCGAWGPCATPETSQAPSEP